MVPSPDKPGGKFMEPAVAEARPTGTETNLLVSISFWQKGTGDASMADLCCCYWSVLDISSVSYCLTGRRRTDSVLTHRLPASIGP